MEPTKTFKEAFCSHFCCPPERFAYEAVFKCLYPHALLFFRIFLLLQTRTTTEAFVFMEKVGQTRTVEELEDVISEYHNDMRDLSTYWARHWNLRVSARAVARLNTTIRSPKKSSQSAPSTVP